MNRKGVIIIRPDSGDPADIICGTKRYAGECRTPEEKGVVHLLWQLFGGTLPRYSSQAVLDPHVRVIYGDSITPERCKDICERLRMKSFHPSNVIFGIGSYTYQYVTRDTFGFAYKATHAIINGEDVMMFKDPVTDKDNMKKSHKGRVVVYEDDGKLRAFDCLTKEEAEGFKANKMATVYENGKLKYEQKYSDVRQRCSNGV
jgi:nicotinamide phosphoribosyltransferase